MRTKSSLLSAMTAIGVALVVDLAPMPLIPWSSFDHQVHFEARAGQIGSPNLKDAA